MKINLLRNIRPYFVYFWTLRKLYKKVATILLKNLLPGLSYFVPAAFHKVLLSFEEISSEKRIIFDEARDCQKGRMKMETLFNHLPFSFDFVG